MIEKDSVSKFWFKCFFEALGKNPCGKYGEVLDAVVLISNNLENICSISEIYELINKLRAPCIVKNIKEYTDALNILRFFISRWDCIKDKVTARTAFDVDRDLITMAIADLLLIKEGRAIIPLTYFCQSGGDSRTKPSMIIDDPVNNLEDTYKHGDKVFFIKQRKDNDNRAINLYLGVVTGWVTRPSGAISCTFKHGFNIMDLETFPETCIVYESLIDHKDFPKSIIKFKQDSDSPEGTCEIYGDITLVPVEDEHLSKINRAIKCCVKGNE